MVTRYECLEAVADMVGDALVIHTGGGTAAEFNALRPSDANMNSPVGAVASMALGLSLALPQRRVIALDTDGGVHLTLSVLPELGNHRPPNLTIIVFDNEVYESTGGQPSATSGRLDLAGMALAAGMEKALTVRTREEFELALREALEDSTCHFMVAKVEVGAKGCPPLKMSGVEMKFRFVRHIEQTEGVQILSPSEQRIPSHLIRD
jgi:thiamine pyrophosphate-dependent acetolactate synthase large subunit-like protein